MLECIIIKMYIHNKKYLIQHIKENKEKYKNIKLVKES